MKILSWRKDLKLNAARCFSGTRATVRVSKATVVTKRLPREACFDQGGCQVEKDVVTLSGEEDEDTLVKEGGFNGEQQAAIHHEGVHPSAW